MLCGVTQPFSHEKLAAMYRDRDDYVARFTQSCDEAVAAGFLLAADAPEIVAVATEAYPVP
jgi:hypothetical protein